MKITFEALKDSSPLIKGNRIDVAEGAAVLDRDATAWIDPEDFDYIRLLDENDGIIEIEVEFNEEMTDLLTAEDSGQYLCYDEDFDTHFPDEDGFGGPEAEIFWAVQYRGGLSAYPKKEFILVGLSDQTIMFSSQDEIDEFLESEAKAIQDEEGIPFEDALDAAGGLILMQETVDGVEQIEAARQPHMVYCPLYDAWYHSY